MGLRSEKHRRTLLLISSLGLILVLGIFFRSFIRAYIIEPAALTLWLLLRIFILSLDQRIYWGLLVIASLVFALRRLSYEIKVIEEADFPDPNVTLENVNIWRNLIQLHSDQTGGNDPVKRDLGNMLAALYTAQQTNPYETLRALKQRQIALPQSIYDFVFSEEADESENPIRYFLKSASTGRPTSSCARAALNRA
ncbi:MAG TPA: hypothetical protein VF498_06250 [Anaerolineales bacterium]